MSGIIIDWRDVLVLIGLFAAWRLYSWIRRRWAETHSILRGLDDVPEVNGARCALCGCKLTAENASGWYYFKEYNGRMYRQNSCIACDAQAAKGGEVGGY